MCLSSSLFVTYFLAVYQKPTNFLYFPLSVMLRACFPRVSQSVSFRKVKPYPSPLKLDSFTIVNVSPGPYEFICTALRFQYFMNSSG